MSKQPIIFETSASGFDKYVISNSHKVPVLVEFMGIWSEPCIAMDDVFSVLAREFAEDFIFAKVDIDEQKELVERFNIENIPTLIVFVDGRPVRTEVGELKQKEARALLQDFGIFNESDQLREEAKEKHLAGDSPAAILLLTEAIKKDPANIRVVMDMVQVLIDIGDTEQARSLFERLPEAAKQTEMGKALTGQIVFINLAEQSEPYEVLSERIEQNQNDTASRFDLAIHQVSRFEYDDAIKNLLYIVKHDPGFNDGAAKEMLSTLSNMFAPVNSELSQQIRRQLANILSE